MARVAQVDEIDVMILRLLQGRGRLARSRMSEQVGRSVPSVSERMRKLEARGVIIGYHAVLEACRLQLYVTAFLLISAEGVERVDALARTASVHDEVLEVHATSGHGDCLLKVRTHSLDTLEELRLGLLARSGVRDVEAWVVHQTHKETRRLPVEPVVLAS